METVKVSFKLVKSPVRSVFICIVQGDFNQGAEHKYGVFVF